MMTSGAGACCVLLSLVVILSRVSLSQATVAPPWVKQEWTAKTLPNPQQNLAQCGRRGKRSWVCDPNGIITFDQADEIDRGITDMHETTGPCVCDEEKCARIPGYRGYQAGVALVNKIYFRESNPSPDRTREVARDFAEGLRERQWKFGMCNDDLIIFVSREDSQVLTAYGQTARRVLTDKCLEMVQRDVEDLLATANYGVAIKDMIKGYTQIFKREHPCNAPTAWRTYSIIGGCCAGLFVLISMIWCARRKCAASADAAERGDGDFSSAQYTSAPGQNFMPAFPSSDYKSSGGGYYGPSTTHGSGRKHGGLSAGFHRDRRDSVGSNSSGGFGGDY